MNPLKRAVLAACAWLAGADDANPPQMPSLPSWLLPGRTLELLRVSIPAQPPVADATTRRELPR